LRILIVAIGIHHDVGAMGDRVIHSRAKSFGQPSCLAVLPFADEVIGLPPAPTFIEPLLAVVPLHIFGMELAQAKGLDVDQPRNLAKSVTVE